MNTATKSSFEEGVDFLLSSSPKNNNKGNQIKQWFQNNFGVHARVSHTTEDKALGNRVSEQFRYKPQVVLFVCKVGLKISSLVDYIKTNNFSELETVLIMYDVKPYKYEQLLVVKENTFSSWAEENFNLQPIELYANDIQHEEDIFEPIDNQSVSNHTSSTYLPYLTALRTKPFMLLAGISGTGKSRIARQIAKACWAADSEERTKQVPSNFCMIQVKPNWHDSTELLGYVSRIDGEKYVAGKFLPFVAKAWENLDVPHILCLDEMNLAPVEQYFAEYLSVIESRKLNEDGTITTDPIITAVAEQWFWDLVQTLTSDGALQDQFKKEGITLPPNLFVIGTVNMDETTFSFSRKVLDRAMTIEMNEVDLEGGLTKEEQNELGEIGNSIIGLAVEGKDIYEDHKDYCDQVIDYLKLVNEELENTPFKIAYRTRNEFLLYAVNRKSFDKESSLETALDEMTSMKILPRIEGDSERVKNPLEALRKLMQERGWDENESISLKKIKEMLSKLQQSGYTSYWT